MRILQKYIRGCGSVPAAPERLPERKTARQAALRFIPVSSRSRKCLQNVLAAGKEHFPESVPVSAVKASAKRELLIGIDVLDVKNMVLICFLFTHLA